MESNAEVNDAVVVPGNVNAVVTGPMPSPHQPSTGKDASTDTVQGDAEAVTRSRRSVHFHVDQDGQEQKFGVSEPYQHDFLNGQQTSKNSTSTLFYFSIFMGACQSSLGLLTRKFVNIIQVRLMLYQTAEFKILGIVSHWC
jgi:hypothetical protein